jgi:predicted AAA+ superfamily ATPase
MIHRIVNPSKNSSFFLFGARGTGKSTFITQQLLPRIEDDFLYYDLLDDETEERLRRSPSLLKTDLTNAKKKPKWIVVDEVQKIPRVLDVVHSMIEQSKIKFILSGSSARKLKMEGANLLAGRAFEYRLFPFSFVELGGDFVLDDCLNYGSLPAVLSFENKADKSKYLKSYVSSYVKLEIQMEQLLRRLDPFRDFLEVAAQMSGKQINYSKIAREVGVDTKTVISYFHILEDTYMGFILPAYHTSLRKSILLTPKFYFFDLGVKRALERALSSEVVPRTSYYGDQFEHVVINEIYRMNCYTEADYLLSYFSTKEGAEVDLVLTRGKKEVRFVEIKSTNTVDPDEVKKMATLVKGTSIQSLYLSQDPVPQEVYGVRCLPWQTGIREIFNL